MLEDQSLTNQISRRTVLTASTDAAPDPRAPRDLHEIHRRRIAELESENALLRAALEVGAR